MEECKDCGKEIVIDITGSQKWESAGAGLLYLVPHKCKGGKRNGSGY